MNKGRKVEIAEYGKLENLFVLFENGKNVLHEDAVKFHLEKGDKNELVRILRSFCKTVIRDGKDSAIHEYTKLGLLKKLDKDDRAKEFGLLWEIRSDRQPGRIMIVIQEDASIIAAAANKATKVKNGKAQDQAIHRGINRWEILLKS